MENNNFKERYRQLYLENRYDVLVNILKRTAIMAHELKENIYLCEKIMYDIKTRTEKIKEEKNTENELI